jgi:transposase
MVSIEFTEEHKLALNYERFHYPDPRVQRKMEVLWLLSQELTCAEAARLAGVSSKTVRRYIKRYRQEGIEALKRSNYACPQSELDGHAETLKEYFGKHPPSTVKQAQAAIEEVTGIRREESQVRAFLKRLGMRRRKTGTVPGKGNEEKWKEQRVFLETKLNPRLDEAEADVRKVFFVDASHFVHGAFLCFLWSFTRLFQRTPSGRKRFNVLGALDFSTKKLVSVTNLTYITSETVCQLLTTLAAQYAGIPITLVLDNARYQRCRLVQDLAESLNIELLFLPSYSPNLNLIERLWKFTKAECLNGKYHADFDSFQDSISKCLNKTSTDHRAAVESLITRNFQMYDQETFLTV